METEHLLNEWEGWVAFLISEAELWKKTQPPLGAPRASTYGENAPADAEGAHQPTHNTALVLEGMQENLA